MREILFRGKTKADKKWIYGNLLQTDNGTYIIQNYMPCLKNCALYCEGYCSINVLAQKTIHDFKKEKKEKEKSFSE